ncbi:SEC-C domain-containing protein [Chloroflexia bacterium SDU3-3]|nr:SEC-C domain-containing protein [Chloroflexia bacterium SDU3-3]
MSKIGRNEPCWCGSGKKYKHCHLAIDEAAAADQRKLKQAGDALLPRIVERAQMHTAAIPAAFTQYWNGKYTSDQMANLDDIEDRGAERFLTWFAFDHPLEDGQTLVEQLASGAAEDFPLSEDEAKVLGQWKAVRLQPYVIDRIIKGKEIIVRELLGETEYPIEDHAASRHVEVGEVLIVHLLPLGSRFYIGGAAAHLTPDTADKLREFADLHVQALRREQPEAGYADLLRTQSHVLNHFVMELPVEEPDPTVFDRILLQTRTALALAGESVGLGRPSEKRED